MTTQALPQMHRESRTVLDVTPDVACLQLSIVNVYLVGEPDAGDRGWVLIDAGLWTSGGSIARAAAERFGPRSRPAAIILTHGHFDHVGAVRELAEHWDAPVFAHPLELPYLTGRSAYPPPDPTVGGGAFSFLSRLFPRQPIDLGWRIHALPADGSLPAMPGWRWIHTPGHTTGHVSLFRDADGVLIAGDAFVTTRQESALSVLTQAQQVWRPPAYFTSDWQAAKRSVERLAALQPSVAATGHGVPMAGDLMRQELRRLVQNFDRIKPSNGRYVRRPAVANEQGVVYVPPAASDITPYVMAGVGLALGGMLLLSATRRDEP